MKLKPNSGWTDIPIGGTIEEPGTAAEYNTGTWRTYRPIWHEDKCIQCLRCWVYCPDSAIIIKDGKVAGTNLFHCKGCGFCARHCPPKANAFDMVLEAEVE